MHEGMPAFEFTGLAGPIRLELQRALPGWYLRSAFVDGVDAAEYPVTIGPSSGRDGPIDVVVARGGGIAGLAVDARGTPVQDYVVVVFPTDASRWYYRSRWLKLARAGDAGRFAVEGLPPGEFWVVAVDWVPGDEQEGEWQTPAALGSLVPGAQCVRVGEGEPATVTLRLVSGQW